MLNKRSSSRQPTRVVYETEWTEPASSRDREVLQHFFQEEMHRLLDAPGGYRDSAFYQALREQARRWLACISDTTQMEQAQLLYPPRRHDPPYFNLKHKGSR